MAYKERDIQRHIISLLKLMPELVPVIFRVNAGAVQTKQDRYVRLAPKGVSDIIGMLRGGFLLAIEVKTPERKNRVTIEQQNFLDIVRLYGGLSFVCWDPEDAVKQINDYTIERELERNERAE
jgi:hypothetical protein|tara:strand:+ start:1454 stop:1822 length:369 start_codon:yes stop_codon:yes gene_type:complete